MSIDGHDTGQAQENLVAPHIFHIKDGLTEGRHEITLDIDNRQIYRISNGMAHAYTDETQTKWNGVLGEMTMEAEPLITDVKVMNNVALVTCSSKRMRCLIDGKNVKGTRNGDTWTFHLPEGLEKWDEFNNNLRLMTLYAGKEKGYDGLLEKKLVR